ncbi:MAG: HipA domain-containing protein [Deltaproteobacteria bacterium]|nr:HipA domain-containing protein [Deltaproteobacteria bacterium]
MDALRSYLTRAGPSAAPQIQRDMGLSKSAFQRKMSPLLGDVLRVGRTRATRYALRRAVDEVRTPTPVYELDPEGGLRLALTLHPVEPMGCWVEGHVAEVASGFHETDPTELGADPAVDLPWFLLDLKPAGFLGRQWLGAHGDAGFPGLLARWSGDDVLRYAAQYGLWLPGAFVVGDWARGRLRDAPGPQVVPRDQAPTVFPALAAASRTTWGSSAGGEQPKFTVTLRYGEAVVPSLVKFSPPMDSPGGRRWADLLLAEHLAHEVLAEAGVAAARSELVDSGGARYLVVRRFDRHGAGGRSGLCSLAALDQRGVGAELRSWSAVTGELVRQGLLSQEDHQRVGWLEAFGHLIANTDMHPGNLSLSLRGTAITGLAPVYDMLPMFHAPRHGGELVEGLYRPAAELGDVPARALSAALTLWERLAADPRASAGFRALAARQGEVAEGVPTSPAGLAPSPGEVIRR